MLMLLLAANYCPLDEIHYVVAETNGCIDVTQLFDDIATDVNISRNDLMLDRYEASQEKERERERENFNCSLPLQL